MDTPSDKQEQTTKDVPVTVAPVGTDSEHVAISLLEGHETSKGPVVESWTIEPVNTEKNPNKEATITMPHLVKKIPQKELLPRPYRTFNQVVVMTYASAICCLFVGLLANRWAWHAKLQNEKGLYGLAKKWARRAVYVSYVAVVLGVIIITSITLNETLTENTNN
ncbi:uncharacterized protein LOC117328202 [Pecten maximus]|uniref:uncharacterized protein LOC117328202 n=1 Tax=Pecten maximus TaxID=6579 RepID=UPI00145831E5|nr:uncharacterized protein LOC117328202 [Pecten maximus]XP_033741532.1 uncharacterized protein LOC117328202 [Pecten maximus]